MRYGRVSQTALKVALTMVTLDKKPGWHERLPSGLAAMSERLILAAGVFGYGPGVMRWSKQGWMVGFYDGFEAFMPGIFEGLGERKIFIDQQVRAGLKAGAAQVLVLGAGFDALCLRLAPEFGDVRFFELDHPATSAAKRRGVEREGRPDNMSLAAVDLARTPLGEALAAVPGWKRSARTVIVAEGLFMYLTAKQVRGLFAAAAPCVGAGSRFVFSHLPDLRRHGIARLSVGLIGEPWRSASATEDLPAYIGPGWKVITSRPARHGRDLEGVAVAEKEGGRGKGK